METETNNQATADEAAALSSTPPAPDPTITPSGRRVLIVEAFALSPDLGKKFGLGERAIDFDTIDLGEIPTDVLTPLVDVFKDIEPEAHALAVAELERRAIEPAQGESTPLADGDSAYNVEGPDATEQPAAPPPSDPPPGNDGVGTDAPPVPEGTPPKDPTPGTPGNDGPNPPGIAEFIAEQQQAKAPPPIEDDADLQAMEDDELRDRLRAHQIDGAMSRGHALELLAERRNSLAPKPEFVAVSDERRMEPLTVDNTGKPVG